MASSVLCVFSTSLSLSPSEVSFFVVVVSSNGDVGCVILLLFETADTDADVDDDDTLLLLRLLVLLCRPLPFVFFVGDRN